MWDVGPSVAFCGGKSKLVGILSALGPMAIVVLGLSAGIYQPVGPDVFVVSSALIGMQPGWAATLALLSTALGGCVGYAFGRGILHRLLGRFFRSRASQMERARCWLERRGVWFIALAGFSPIPLTQVAWAAGSLRVNFLRFLAAMVLGLLPRFALEAAFAAQLRAWIH